MSRISLNELKSLVEQQGICISIVSTPKIFFYIYIGGKQL